MNRVYAILRNMCWAFGADLAFLIVLIVVGALEHKAPEWLLTGIFRGTAVVVCRNVDCGRHGCDASGREG